MRPRPRPHLPPSGLSGGDSGPPRRPRGPSERIPAFPSSSPRVSRPYLRSRVPEGVGRDDDGARALHAAGPTPAGHPVTRRCSGPSIPPTTAPRAPRALPRPARAARPALSSHRRGRASPRSSGRPSAFGLRGRPAEGNGRPERKGPAPGCAGCVACRYWAPVLRLACPGCWRRRDAHCSSSVTLFLLPFSWASRVCPLESLPSRK